jgi:UDP-N-acetyl-D-glucosamine dehydrogenase
MFFITMGAVEGWDCQGTPANAHLEQSDAVVIMTDHSSYDYAQIVEQAQLVSDTLNATHGIDSQKIVRC